MSRNLRYRIVSFTSPQSREPGTLEGTAGVLKEEMGSGLEIAISVRSPRDTRVTRPPSLRTDFPAPVIKREAQRRIHPILLINPSPPQSLRGPWLGRLLSLSWVVKALSLWTININKLHGSRLNYLSLIVAQPKIQPPATQASLNRDYLVSVSGGPFGSKSFVLCRQTWKPYAAPLCGLKSSLEQ